MFENVLYVVRYRLKFGPQHYSMLAFGVCHHQHRISLIRVNQPLLFLLYLGDEISPAN